MKPGQKDEINIIRVNTTTLSFYVLGKTPLICNAMSAKVSQGLLFPAPKKTAADKASTLKHNPLQEFRDSVYRSTEKDAPTRIVLPSTAFKGALRSVATDMPGAAKAQIGRLTYVEGEHIHIYGIPRLSMMLTRMADINRTPDIRTRAILPEWACKLSVTFTTPILKEQAVANLLAAAGLMRGVGDGRTEKGWGNYGQFELVGDNDKRFQSIVRAGGIKAQDAALLDPEPHDRETAELLTWFQAETARRGFKVA